VKVEAAGFRTEIRSSVELQVQAAVRLDFRLQAGQGMETTAEGTAQLNTEDSTSGGVVENRRVVDLPMNGRDYTQMVALSANVVNTSGATNGANGVAIGVGNANAATNQGGARANSGFGIAGQRSSEVMYSLDGLSNMDVNFNLATLQMSIDAIKEFKVQTGLYPAEFGRELGQVNVSTISGGNQYHGVLFEFLRNNKVDAVTYQFTPVAPVTPPFKWNQYGFTLDGPLSIPRVFNAKNRLFFMANFEGFNQRGLTNTVYNVPTPAMRGGDLSGGLTSPTGLLYYPYGRVQNANGSITATPVPGNIIPASQIAADSILQMPWCPLPNQPITGTNKNYLASPATPIDKDQFTARMDFNESARSAWFGRFSWTSESQSTPTLGGGGSSVITGGYQYLVSNTRVFSATKVNEARFGISQLNNNFTQFVAPVDWVAALGLPGLLAHMSPATWGMPMAKQIGGGLSNFGDPTNGPYILHDATFQGNDNFSWVRGKHSFRFGGELRRDRYNQFGNANDRGAFYFSGYDTSNPASPQSNVWTGWGSYLLGATSQVQGAVNMAFAQMRATSAALYFDDAWHVSPKVTISLGLRWEEVQPYWDKSGHESNVALPYVEGINDSGNVMNMALHPVLVRAGSGGFYDSTGINYPGVQVARDGRLGDRLQQTNHANFAPRIGVAWSPSAKWAVRMGGGLFYVQESANHYFDMERAVTGSFNLTNSATLPTFNWTTYLTPGATLQIPTPAIYADDTNMRTSRVYQWLTDVQRVLSPSTMYIAQYTGSLGRYLNFMYNSNQPTASAIGTPASRTPFPELGIVTTVNSRDDSNYNALSMRLQRRAHGITFTGSFTWAHSLDYGSGLNSTDQSMPQNSRCFQCEYGPSAFNLKNRFVLSAVYDLPFGKGEKFANTGGVINQIVGGWQVSVIYTLATGLAGTAVITTDQANTAGAGDRPNATGVSAISPNPTPNQWVNLAAYATQPFGTFGNTTRGTYLRPGTNEGDLILARNFKIKEGHSLQFRYEAYNFLNHPVWGPPIQVYNSTTFGQVTLTSVPMRQMQFSLKYKF
jgi:hypothetical protein